MWFRGTGSLKNVDKLDPCSDAVAPETKPAAKKKPGKANPYSARGLDKFHTVLSELDSRREKILQRVGSDNRVMVRFVQSESQKWVPVVVKLPEEPKDTKKSTASTPAQASPPQTMPTSPKEVAKHVTEPTGSPKEGAKLVAKEAAPAKKKASQSQRLAWALGKVRPRHYMPFAMVLVLLSLVVFGRAFAICCTSIWWYFVPSLSGYKGSEEGQGMRRSMAKAKDLGKKASDKKMGEKLVVPPTHAKKSSGGGVIISPRSHAHAKKG